MPSMRKPIPRDFPPSLFPPPRHDAIFLKHLAKVSQVIISNHCVRSGLILIDSCHLERVGKPWGFIGELPKPMCTFEVYPSVSPERDAVCAWQGSTTSGMFSSTEPSHLIPFQTALEAELVQRSPQWACVKTPTSVREKYKRCPFTLLQPLGVQTTKVAFCNCA